VPIGVRVRVRTRLPGEVVLVGFDLALHLAALADHCLRFFGENVRGLERGGVDLRADGEVVLDPVETRRVLALALAAALNAPAEETRYGVFRM